VFYAILYRSHQLNSVQNFTKIIPGELLRRGLNAKGVAKYSDIWHVEGYISETVQGTVSGETHTRRIRWYHFGPCGVIPNKSSGPPIWGNRSDSNRAEWKHQSKLLRSTLRRRYIDYWSKTIADNANDSTTLWSKLSILLKTTQQSLSATHSATDTTNTNIRMGDRVGVQLLVREIYLSLTNHPGQLSLAIPP